MYARHTNASSDRTSLRIARNVCSTRSFVLAVGSKAPSCGLRFQRSFTRKPKKTVVTMRKSVDMMINCGLWLGTSWDHNVGCLVARSDILAAMSRVRMSMAELMSAGSVLPCNGRRTNRELHSKEWPFWKGCEGRLLTYISMFHCGHCLFASCG